MFQHILVPLDGSARAEQALPLAGRIARASGGSLLLQQVVTTRSDLQIYGPGSTLFLQELQDQDSTRATVYLSRIAQSPILQGIEKRIAIFPGNAASSILECIQEHHIDLMVLCSHGFTGMKRWALGSVAQQVVRHSPVPVLVVRDGAHAFPQERPIRTLVGLDGSPLAEATLEPAIHLTIALSAPFGGVLHLVRVLPFSTAFEYGQEDSVAQAKRQATREAQQYFQHLQQHLLENIPEQHLSLETSLATSRDVAETLISIAERGEGEGMQLLPHADDVLALATHGRGGLQRWMMGSVAERVLGATRLPLLIVHPHQ